MPQGLELHKWKLIILKGVNFMKTFSSWEICLFTFLVNSKCPFKSMEGLCLLLDYVAEYPGEGRGCQEISQSAVSFCSALTSSPAHPPLLPARWPWRLNYTVVGIKLVLDGDRTTFQTPSLLSLTV